MKQTVLFMLEDGNAQKVEAQAFSKESANIYITAATMQEAHELLTQGEELARQAMQNWKPEDQPEEPAKEEPKKHYYYVSRSMEEMDERAAAFADTPAGKRFCKSIENAKAFTFKHSRGGLRCEEMDYLANLHYNSFLNGSFDIAALEYRRGYMQAKREAKAI